jgi:1-acyl-sn-glycerol-3-phosphate acyltransferase
MRAEPDPADRTGREASAGRGDVERAVLDLCASLGNGAPAGSLDTPLDLLGLDSLACADLAVAVQDRFGVRLSEVELGAVRTPREVVQAIVEGATVARRRLPFPPTLGRSQRAARRITRPFLRWYARMEVAGQENVPATGPVIVAPNHRSMLDIPVLVAGSPRQVYFMAKQELYKGPLLRLLWRELGGFPVRRQVFDLRALEAAAGLLDRGEAVAMYPEGTRNYTADPLLPFLRGPAWLALRTGVPIVPCGVRGTGSGAPLWRRRRIRVTFGAPIPVERVTDREARRRREQEVTARLAQAVRDLL